MAPSESSRRAIVAMNRRSPLTSVATGRNSGALAWCVLWVRPSPWIALIGAPAGFQEVVDAPFGVSGGEVGVIAAARASRHGKDQDALVAAHERGGFGEIGGCRTGAQREPFSLRVDDFQHASGASGDFRHRVMPEVLHDLVEGRGHGRERCELLDKRVASGGGLQADDGASVVVEDGPRHEVAVLVGERLLKLHREGVEQELDHGLARREVDGDVVPFGCRDLGDAPFQQGFAGRDELHHGGPAGVEVGLDRADQRGALHRRQEVPEETLLRALEGRQRGGLRSLVERGVAVDDARGLEGLADVAVDDLERLGIGVVDAPLGLAERVLQDVDLHAVVGKRSGLIKSEGLEIARNDFERGDAARFHRGDEIGPRLERGFAGGPQPQTLGIGEAGKRGGAGGRDVGDACVGQGALELQALRGPAARA